MGGGPAEPARGAAAGERIELPVKFIVDPALPKEIGSLSLGYTLFDITDRIEITKDLAKL